ncbi:heme exporter protein CcmD [Endozoicomonas numazuensis]|uniref:heme exporter protein CcmD n=1 Tax=Endozoicomonas numazuensis TaxID=1137799 RepID=UPI0005538D9F|nr:heme exporter protein CcmD [Endozoicomonas numazuensis]
MYFDSLASLIHMDGHGIYVWSTYGIGLLIIAYNIVSPLRARKRIVAQIQRQVRSNQSRNRSSSNAHNHSPRADSEKKKKKVVQREDRVSHKDQGVREGKME